VAHDTVWELVFLMVILKIPIVYLSLVVWHAIKAVPPPPEPETLVRAEAPDFDAPTGLHPARRRQRLRPRGGPTRTYPRTPRTATAGARNRSGR
jgi:hypothetical protein